MDINQDFDLNAHIKEQLELIKKANEDIKKREYAFEAKKKIFYLNYKKDNNFYEMIKKELRDIKDEKIRIKEKYSDIAEKNKDIEYRKRLIQKEYDELDKQKDEVEKQKENVQKEYIKLEKEKKELDEQIIKIQNYYKELAKNRKS